jgi:hypothetical protein
MNNNLIGDFLYHPLLNLVLGWFAKSSYDKYFNFVPVLNVDVQSYNRGQNGDFVSPSVKYDIIIKIKNSSPHTAYNILFEIPEKNEIGPFNNSNLNNKIGKFFHICANTEETIKLDFTKYIKQDDFYNITIEDGKKIINGLKHKDPISYYKPKELYEIRFCLSYKNEKDKRFRTSFKMINGIHRVKHFRFLNPNFLNQKLFRFLRYP